MLPSATLKISSVFACRTFDVEDEDMSRWLKVDYSVNCDSGSHTFYKIIASIMALVYPIGIPFCPQCHFPPLWQPNWPRKNYERKGTNYADRLDNTANVRVPTIQREEKLNPGKGQHSLVNLKVVKYKIVSDDSDESKDGYVVGDQNELSEAMTKLDAELVTLDEDRAMYVAKPG